MLSWSLAFFILATIAAVFGFTGVVCGGSKQFAAAPPAGWSCPDGWSCSARFPLPAPDGFVCPAGWQCSPSFSAAMSCDGAEIAKILFTAFVVLFMVSLVAGLLRRP